MNAPVKRVAIPQHLANEAMAKCKRCCTLCGINVARLDIVMRALPSSWETLNTSGRPAAYGKRDRFTQTTNQGALLGRHKDRAHTLLGRLWGISLWPGCHFHEIDHIQAVAEGGTNTIDNLRVLCRRCHKDQSIALNARLRRRPSKGVGRG